jgi:hypothetical protein
MQYYIQEAGNLSIKTLDEVRKGKLAVNEKH